MEQKTLLIRYLRRRRELSLDKIAADTSINVSTVSRMERGLIRGTDEQRLVMAGYFGRTIEELFGAAPNSEVA